MIQLDNILKVDQNETQKMVTDSAQEFSEQYIRPFYMEWDEAQYFPFEVLRKAGSLGFMGILIPEIYGGAGMGYQEYISIIIEISKVDPSIGLSIAAHNSLATEHIHLFGNEEQKYGVNKIFLPHLYSYCKTINLDVAGLMCIPPINKPSEIFFKEMNKLNKKLNFEDLSMGMSSDYLDAIKNSATYIRIGSNIFGKRN